MLTGSMVRKLNARELNLIRQMEAKGTRMNHASLEKQLQQCFRSGDINDKSIFTAPHRVSHHELR